MCVSEWVKLVLQGLLPDAERKQRGRWVEKEH